MIALLWGDVVSNMVVWDASVLMRTSPAPYKCLCAHLMPRRRLMTRRHLVHCCGSCIVSTAEKARDAAQRALSYDDPPYAQQAYDTLLSGLRRQQVQSLVLQEINVCTAQLKQARQALAGVCEAHGIKLPGANSGADAISACACNGDVHSGVSSIQGAEGAPEAVGHGGEGGNREGVSYASGVRDAVADTAHAAPGPGNGHVSGSNHTGSNRSGSSNTGSSTGSRSDSTAVTLCELPGMVLLSIVRCELAVAQAKAIVLQQERLLAEKLTQRLAAQLNIVSALSHGLWAHWE